MADGIIFNIQKFCINDGPGIRTTVFFKGCPLRCRWCHNPESQRISTDLLFSAEKCVLCGKCALVCKNNAHKISDTHFINRKSCVSCKECETACVYDALSFAGKRVSADEVIKTVLSDKEFFEDSGGGLTVSGGEPFMQPEFLSELLKKAKENSLHTCVETCGFADKKVILALAELVDIFLFDYKLSDTRLHKEYTGAGNEKIIENLYALNERGSKIILRCPVIPGVNDNEEHFKGIAKTANKLENVMGIEIAPYHELGISKSQRLDESADIFDVPEKDDVQRYIDFISSKTLIPVKKM